MFSRPAMSQKYSLARYTASKDRQWKPPMQHRKTLQPGAVFASRLTTWGLTSNGDRSHNVDICIEKVSPPCLSSRGVCFFQSAFD